MPQPAGTVITRVLADPVRMYLPSDYWNRARDFFVWSLDFNTLGAGVTANRSFEQQNDSDFLCLGIVSHAATTTDATAEQVYQDFLINVQDTGSGASWFGGDDAGFAHIMNICGGMRQGASGSVARGDLEHPRFLPAASTVTVTLTSFDAAARRVFISFRGVKIYRSLRQGV